MNTNHFSRLVLAAAGLAAFPTLGCSQKERDAATMPSPAKEVATAVPGPTTPVPAAATASPAPAGADWRDLKDSAYDLRARVFAGLKRLEARVDDQIGELNAKRAAMKGTTSTQDWDFAMKEMENSRTYLQAMGAELRQATRETWDQRKEKIGQAWERTQAAYGKVKASTTS